MSYLWRLLSSLLLSIYFIFILSFVSGATLEISPPSLEFNGEVDKLVCEELIVSSAGNTMIVNIQDFWKEGRGSSRDINEFILFSSELNIQSIYQKRLVLREKTPFSICLKGREGVYHGLLFFNVENYPLGIGIWITAKFGSHYQLSSENLLTGKVVKTDKNEGETKYNPVTLLLIAMSAMLLGVFGFLITKLLSK